MRIFLLPISTRRTLLYCERLHSRSPDQQTYLDKAINKANATWATWERVEKGWKKSTTAFGNKILRRIPYEEWGLKTIPHLNAKRRKQIEEGKVDGQDTVDILFPGRYLHENKVLPILEELAKNRQALHKKRLIGSILSMPLTIPFMIIPIIPNLPFFYLVFRAYSHWKALSGSQHLQELLQHRLLSPTSSSTLDTLYTAGLMYPTRTTSRSSPSPNESQIASVSDLVEKQTNDQKEDVMVLQRWNGKLLAERFELPDMEVEIERAVEQVERIIKGEAELREEKEEIEVATGNRSESENERRDSMVEKEKEDDEDEKKEKKGGDPRNSEETERDIKEEAEKKR